MINMEALYYTLQVQSSILIICLYEKIQVNAYGLYILLLFLPNIIV